MKGLPIRGYPELHSHSYIDGYACFSATASGLQQVTLKTPKRIYHQEHDRSEHGSRPLTDYQRFIEDGSQMLSLGQPKCFNTEDWGLGSQNLMEYGVGV
jgi:hypothetical protein